LVVAIPTGWADFKRANSFEQTHNLENYRLAFPAIAMMCRGLVSRERAWLGIFEGSMGDTLNFTLKASKKGSAIKFEYVESGIGFGKSSDCRR
jgi:hypothetical protein